MNVNSDVDVIYEDNHLLIVNKPCGVLVQGDNTGDIPLAEICKSYIKKKYAKPGEVFLGVIHRLDRPVSGVVAFARTSKALERMNELFREKTAHKTYWAIVKQKPPKKNDTLIHWLSKDEKKNRTTAYTRETPGAQRSELRYDVLGQAEGYWLLQVEPVTGRPHQIRVQLASMGCPIKGDVKYGDDSPELTRCIYLHSRNLAFVHPVKKESVSFSAPLPADEFWKFFLTFEKK